MNADITTAPLSVEDLETVAGWLSAPETNRWLTAEWRGRAIDPVTLGVALRNRKNRFFIARCGGTACALVALAEIDPADKTAMVWYVLGNKEVARRGVTTAAVRQIVKFAFCELGFESLYAWIIEDNIPSRRVLEKAGFREAGRLRRAVCRNGEQLARQYFDLVKDDIVAR